MSWLPTVAVQARQELTSCPAECRTTYSGAFGTPAWDGAPGTCRVGAPHSPTPFDPVLEDLQFPPGENRLLFLFRGPLRRFGTGRRRKRQDKARRDHRFFHVILLARRRRKSLRCELLSRSVSLFLCAGHLDGLDADVGHLPLERVRGNVVANRCMARPYRPKTPPGAAAESGRRPCPRPLAFVYRRARATARPHEALPAPQNGHCPAGLWRRSVSDSPFTRTANASFPRVR